MAGNGSIQPGTESKGIKDLLIRQYVLHETAHHEAPGRSETAIEVVTPRAHAVSDIYKCLHQGTFGVGHSIQSPVDFRHRLANEIRRAVVSRTEPLLENVSADSTIYRVNLRPLRALFENEEDKGCEFLVRVCLESATIRTGSPEEFQTALKAFRELDKAGELQVEGRAFAFPKGVVDRFLLEIQNFVAGSGFIPVLSHSPDYRSLNQPSYRVVHVQALMRSPLAFFLEKDT